MTKTEMRDAILAAGPVRLRPILMTAVSFILGVLPLVVASGAGAEDTPITGTLTAVDDADGLTDGTYFTIESGDNPANGTATIDPATGVVSMVARDFEAPVDANTDKIGRAVQQECRDRGAIA